MDKHKEIEIHLTTQMVREIEPIFERINGLEELLMIIPVSDSYLRNKVNTELADLNEQRDRWLSEHNEGICIDAVGMKTEIDFSRNILRIINKFN